MPITGHSLESTPAFVEMTARRGAGRELSQECPPIVASHDLSRPKPRGLMRGRYSCARNAAREKWLPLIQGSKDPRVASCASKEPPTGLVVFGTFGATEPFGTKPGGTHGEGNGSSRSQANL